MDILIEAYKEYRMMVADPWPLTCCGRGPLGRLLEGIEGIRDLGFVQPKALPRVLASASAFVLPSRSDAWGVALVEACAAGLPVICTDVCGSSVELVRELGNGLIVPPEQPGLLAEAMVWMHRNRTRLEEMGNLSHCLARPYSAELWADQTGLRGCWRGCSENSFVSVAILAHAS